MGSYEHYSFGEALPSLLSYMYRRWVF